MEELEYGNNDVLEILWIFRSMASSIAVRRRMTVAYELYRKLPSENVKNLIRAYVCLADNEQRDRKFSRLLAELERKVLMDLFLSYAGKL